MLTYHGLTVGRAHRDSFARVKAAVELGDLRSIDVKKLSGAPFHRAKLGYADRLLLQFLRYEGETVCVALEIIQGHAYDRSRFLRGAPVDEALLESEPVPAPETLLASPTPYLHPTRSAVHYLDKALSFDDAQDAILRTPCPLLLVGSAGSGKTALTLEKMRGLPGEIAYVTRSAYLADSARSLYFACGFEAEGQAADFLSFSELIESLRVPVGRPVTFTDFRQWFERHRNQVRFADAHQCLEEIRGVLSAQPQGPLSLERYLALGVRQSMFTADQRVRLHELFLKYRAWIEAAGLFDTNDIAHRYLSLAEPRYDFIVIDEVQDLTNVELSLILALLRKPGQFVLTGDANQIVHPNFFSWSALKSLFFRDPDLAARHALSALDVNYRNAASITRVANTLLKVKNARFGSVDRETTALIRPVSSDPGEVIGVASDDAVVRDIDARTRRSTKYAVLVLRDEHKVEARKRFRTPLLFSVHEAKGLEYDSVILFDFVSSERAAYREVTSEVTEQDLAGEDLVFRRAKDKEDKSLEVYKFYVNALYVAMTRAIKRLYVVESDPAHPLLSLLGVSFDSAAKPIDEAASSAEEWQREARKLELQGKREQAEAIRKDVLQIAPVPWKVVDAARYAELSEKAFAPRSVFNKAKQQLFDYACFHEDPLLASRLVRDASFQPTSPYDTQRPLALARQLKPYESKNLKEVLWDVDRYGVEMRTPMNVTPLALAAAAGNVPLVESLLARGARRDAADPSGRWPLHWAVLRAYDDGQFAKGPFGTLYDLLAPASIDVKTDDRLFKIGREQGEYFCFVATMALFKRLYSRFGRIGGLQTKTVMQGAFTVFPESVVRSKRRKRTYLNQLLARNEPGSSYHPNRKLWIRERTGHYLPNPSVSLRVVDGDGTHSFVPLHDVLGLADLQANERRAVDAFRHSSPAWAP